MTDYLKPNDPLSFLDFPARKLDLSKDTKICHVCFGFGGWNLQVFAYDLPKGIRNTAKNRHLHRHFRASCSQCNGWGVVESGSKNDTCPEHDWVKVRNTGRCLTLYECSKCGLECEVDSSD